VKKFSERLSIDRQPLLAFVARVIRPVHFTSADLPFIHCHHVKEITRTLTNLRLPLTRGSDDPRLKFFD
jgi:hypothetical protein